MDPSSSSSNQENQVALPVVAANQQQPSSASPSSSSGGYQRTKPQRLNNKFQGGTNRNAARNDSVASSSSSSGSTLRADQSAESTEQQPALSATPTTTVNTTGPDSGGKKKKQQNAYGKQPGQGGGKANNSNYRGGYQYNKANNRHHHHHMIDSDAAVNSPPASNGGFRSGNGNGGSKKTNLNHLLNFTYESMRDSGENYYEYERMTKQFWSTKLAKNSYFSKEQFLQANCQFVVKSTGDYSVHLSDPDLLVEWDKIEEIHISSHESIVCPICLYPPQASKMTKCGHVYCWSCILHYLALSDKSWRKCPICFESIYKKDLKSLRVIEQPNEFKLGDEISFNLMFKSKSKYSSLILPMSVHEQFQRDEQQYLQSHPSSPAAINFKLFNKPEYSGCLQYIKLYSKGNKDIFEQVIKRERDELNQQIESEKNQPEVCFVTEALQLLDERERALGAATQLLSAGAGKVEAAAETTAPVKKKDESEPMLSVLSVNVAKVKYADAFDEKTAKPEDQSSGHSELSSSSSSPPESPRPPVQTETTAPPPDRVLRQEPQPPAVGGNDYSFFYQSTDGQRIYISALNARCLVHEYSSFVQCPLTITGKIVACDSFFMSEENRKRYKYLAHLPLHSEFKVVELDLKEPFLSQKTLDAFRHEIGERRQMRARKEIREKRMADKMAAATAVETSYWVPSAAHEVMVFGTQRNENSESVVDYSNEFPEASTSPTVSSGISIGGNSYSESSSQQQPASVSFAQMLKHRNMSSSGPSKTATNTKGGIQELDMWPSLDSNPPPSTTASTAASSLLNLNQTNPTQLTSGWLTLVKNQEQTLGRAKKYQEAPRAWGLASKNETLTSIVDKLEEERQQGESEDDSMPAPLYQASFFSAIDASLKSIESRKQQSSNPFDVNESNQHELNGGGATSDQKQPASSSTAAKKKKKTKQLLFSTSLNMGV